MKKFFEEFQDQEITVLVRKKHYYNFLREMSNFSTILRFKVIILEDLIKSLTYAFKDDASYQLAKDFDIKESVARVYLNNLKYLKLIDPNKISKNEKLKYDRLLEVLDFLKNADLITNKSLFINFLKKKELHLAPGTDLSLDETKILIDFIIVKHDFSVFNNGEKTYSMANNQFDLYFHIFEKIARLIKEGVSVKDIHLVSQKPDEFYLRFFSSFYPFEIELGSRYLLEFNRVKDHLKRIQEGNFKIEKLKNDEIDSAFLKIYQRYLKDLDFSYLVSRVKDTEVRFNSENHQIKVISVLEALALTNKHLIIFTLNSGNFYSYRSDEDYFLDATKNQFDLDTSFTLNQKMDDELDLLLASNNQLYLYAISKDKNQELSLMSQIENYQKNVLPSDYFSSFSSKLNRVLLEKYLNSYQKFLKDSKSLSKLINTYDYNPSFDNSFKCFPLISNNVISFSYSSLKNMMNSSVYYYIEKVLKISNFEGNFYIVIGEVFHKALELKYSNKTLSSDECYDEALDLISKKYDISISERAYLNIMRENYYLVDDAINYQDSLHDYHKVLLEEKFLVETPFEYQGKEYIVELKGFVDKILYKEVDGKTYLTIIDYKTGNNSLDLDNFKKGEASQLAIYIYLVLKSNRFVNPVISGIYLNHILSSSPEFLTGYTNVSLGENLIFDKSILKGSESSLVNGLSTIKDGSYAKKAKIIDEMMCFDLIKQVEEAIINAAKKVIDNDYSVKILNAKTKLADALYQEYTYVSYKDLYFEESEDDSDVD